MNKIFQNIKCPNIAKNLENICESNLINIPNKFITYSITIQAKKSFFF